MARRFTIRTKLVAGLALVLAISAVLTVNTLLGLYSYRDSIKAIDSQKKELDQGKRIWDEVSALDATTRWEEEAVSATAGFAGHLDAVERELERFQSRLASNMRRGRDPDHGRLESDLLHQIESKLSELKRFMQHHNLGAAPGPFQLQWNQREDLSRMVSELRNLVANLQVPISRDMGRLVEDAELTYHMNLIVGWSTGLLVVILMLVLARLTYFWIFRPVRLLHASVQCVGSGDLDHRVRLETGDEMQELAESFNSMTSRLQEICKDLESQVEDRSRQLVRSERLASVGFLAAGVAHEINNPLASISLSAEAVKLRLRKLLPQDHAGVADMQRYLSMIESEAFRCKGITEKLLDFSRMRDVEREPTSLVNLVADVIDVVQHLGRYRDKNIVLHGNADVVAELNPQEIKQVVLNLVVNALDSMSRGGTLEIEAVNEGGCAVLRFTDDGCGMTSEVLENIFEPFFTRKQSGRGTGLGLSISHRIVTDHAGHIEAHSSGPNQGSQFLVRLPLVQTKVKEDSRRGKIAA